MSFPVYSQCSAFHFSDPFVFLQLLCMASPCRPMGGGGWGGGGRGGGGRGGHGREQTSIDFALLSPFLPRDAPWDNASMQVRESIAKTLR